MSDEPQHRSNAGNVAIAGGIVGLLPFLIHSMAESVTTVNGAVTTFTVHDTFAIGGGAIAVALGLTGLALGLRRHRDGLAIGLCLAAVALGGFQIARGFGTFAHAETDATMTAVVAPHAAPPPDPDAPCETGSACFSLARQLRTSDPRHALAAFKRTCELEHADGCFEAAVMSPPSDPATTALYQRACDLGLASGCTNAATAYLTGDGVPKDPERALKMLIAACDANEPLGCRNASVIYRDGLGVDRDLQKTREFAAKACDRSEKAEAASCTSAGVGYAEAPERAYTYFTKACDRDPSECHNLAVVTATGNGAPADQVAARLLYSKACEARNLQSCNNLGILVRDGLGGAKDLDAARGFFSRACSGGEQMGCANLRK